MLPGSQPVNANIANEMEEAGYGPQEKTKIKSQTRYYENIRSEIKLASGDYIDLKAYEPAMRHLIDAYIDSDESRTVSAFDDLTLIDLIINKGEDFVDSLPKNIRENERSTAETIENNVRRLIIEEKPTNPKYFERMSVLLDELIRQRKEQAIRYKQYLKQIVELTRKIKNPATTKYPKEIDTNSKRALYDNLENNEKLALKINQNIIEYKQDGWKGSRIKEKQVKNAIRRALKDFDIQNEKNVETILELAKKQNDY